VGTPAPREEPRSDLQEHLCRHRDHPQRGTASGTDRIRGYDIAHLYNLAYFDQKLARPPLFVQSVLASWADRHHPEI
jgi:hypothetical protein